MICPTPRSVSSGRSPARPTIAETGARAPSVAERRRRSRRRRRRARRPGLVVGKVDHDHAMLVAEEVQPAAGVLGGRDEGAQPGRDVLERHAERPRRGGRRQGVRDVMRRHAAEGHGHVREIRDGPPSSAVGLAELAVAHQVGAAAAAKVAPHDGRRVAAAREERHAAAHVPRDAGDVLVVRVQHDPAVWLRHAGDDALDLRQLGQRVDALQVHVVRRDVRDDARLVRLVADAAQEHPAARGLEHRDVDVLPPEDRARAARARSNRPARRSCCRRRSRRRWSFRPASPPIAGCARSAASSWSCRSCRVIETIGSFRSASRIHVGSRARGRADPLAAGRAIARSCRGVRLTCAPGRTSRSTRRSALSAIVCARSPSCHGQSRIQWPGIGRAMDDDRALRAIRMRPSQQSDPVREGRESAPAAPTAARPRASRTSWCRSGSRLPYQVRRRPIATSSLIAGSSRYRFGPSSRRISIRRTVRRG